MATIKFTKLEEFHFPLLLKWLNSLHVKKWWDKDMSWDYEIIKAKYHTYVKNYKLLNGQKKAILPFIINIDSTPIGYIQLYNAHDYHFLTELKSFPNPLPSIDVYIGETEYLNKGFGAMALNKFILEYASNMGNTIFVTSDKENITALKMYKACGFTEAKHVENEIWLTFKSRLRIHCQEPWFSKIKSGLKTVEGRKYNSKYLNLKPGDLLEFYCDDMSFLTEVVTINKYKTLEEYLEVEGFKNVLPGVNSFYEAMAIYLQYSSHDELSKAGGFLGIHIKVLT